ncbi:MAG TPA: sensor histidine kinase [Candidatus Acidoferrales bacterium]|nr:sensor histidine kinase [Candidatus Acidoferrales bacterium]
MAVTEERSRLAREIHDTLVQSFAGIVLHTEALGTSLDVNNSRSQQMLLTIQKLARSGLDEARRSVQALRPKMLDGRTLAGALEETTEQLCETGLFCRSIQRGMVFKLPEEVQTELFRIAQEAMTNVQKHARAKSVWITLEFKINQLVLTIQDDGIGFADAKAPGNRCGYGMTCMRERAKRIGAALEIECTAGGGFLIRVRVPLAENKEDVNCVKPNETVKN